MSATVTVLARSPSAAQAEPRSLELDWGSPGANVVRNLGPLLQALPQAPPPVALDLVDLATAVYIADLAVPRGRNEQWVRRLSLSVEVREPDFWREQASFLSSLLYLLSRDSLAFDFVPLTEQDQPTIEVPSAAAQPDCLCLLSGGIDSMAAALSLLRTGRQPLTVSHHSGNVTVRQSQERVLRTLGEVCARQPLSAGISLHAASRPGGLPFPPPEQREPSQRTRSLLYMSLAVLAASGCPGVEEIILGENGILTVAAPLAGSRVGGLSTRSTHPRVISLMNELCQGAGLGCQIVNPFVYQTKAELIRDVLSPCLPPDQIRGTISCWAAGRSMRQCGGCVACLIRRLSMRAAGLPDEAYEVDVLASPSEYVGTDAYTNLMDLLTQVRDFQDRTDLEVLGLWPELLDLEPAGVSLPDVLDMYRRYADEVTAAVREHYPACRPLLGSG